MMNDPVMMIANALRSGKNPTVLLQQMAMQFPEVQQMVKIMDGKSPDQLKAIANNMARERGTTIEDVARSLGIQIPGNR